MKSRHTRHTPLPRKAIGALFLALLLAGAWLSVVPAIVALAYVAMSCLAVLLYRADKAAAVNRQWRTQESTLHLAALLGGWPGALLAQDIFRHKSSKASFQFAFWTTVAINCGALAWLLANGRASAFSAQILGF